MFQILVFFLIVMNGYSQSSHKVSMAYLEKDKSPQQKENEVLLKNALEYIEKKFEVFINYDDKILQEKYVNKQIVIESQKINDAEKSLLHLLSHADLQVERIKENIFLISTRKENVNKSKSSGFIQEKQITGKITDENGEGLPGVSVIVKGTTLGTVTDMSGNFSLVLPDDASTLVISFIGYVSQEIAVDKRTTIKVALEPDVTSLNEVVVIGYQTVRKQDLTGAISTIDPSKANRVTTNSVAESLQGLTPGVTVRTGGAPGQMSKIEIRGAASFTNTDPLYVIDGMIADANTTINNNDIESIQILKDASAGAIYGSRAANGVVIITTKQGKEGPAKVNFSAKYGVQNIPKRWDMMNASEFAATQRTQYENSGQPAPASVSTEFNPAIDTDWQDQAIKQGSLQDYNLSLSGGSKTGTYLLSGSYFTNDGVLIGNSFNRASFRVNTKVTKGRVTFGENMLITNSNQRWPGEGNPFYDMPQMLPIIPVRGEQYISESNPEGWGIGSTDAITYAWNSVGVNQLASRTANFAKLVGNGYADVKLLSWLNYRFNTGIEVSYDHNKYLRKIGIFQFNGAPKPSSVDEERSRFLNLLFEHTLNFNKVIGLHNVNGVVGLSQQNIIRETTAGGRTDLQIYNNEYMTTLNSATGVSTAGGGRPTDYKILGYLGRVNYSYNDKYLLTLTGRVDQDSRFSSSYRTGFYPSVAVAWRVSKENFFNFDPISDLKLHASYGRLGVVTVNPWEYTSFINSSPRAVFGPDQFPYVGSIQARLANKNLQWENRTVQNIGMNLALLNNRVLVNLEAYNSLSSSNLLYLPVAGYLGNLEGPPPVNAGSIRNSGIEFSATYRSTERELKWDVSANFTTIKNKVEDVGNQGKGIDYITVGNARTQVGRSLGEWYIIKTDGLFQSQADIDSYVNAEGKMIQPNAKPGDIKFIDKNGDGTINAEDRTYVGSPWPKLQTGAQFNASYKGITFNLQLVGVFGNMLYNDTRRVFDSYQRTNFRKDLDPWSPTNTGGKDPRLALDTEQGIIDNNRPDSDRWIENGSYLRIRNVEIGYNIPNNILGNAATLNNARIFLSGQNLLTLTKYSGLDPDLTSNGILDRGVDYGNWPTSRAFLIGIQCGF